MMESNDQRSDFADTERQVDRNSTNGELTPTSPAEAVKWYLDDRATSLSKKSIQNQRYRLEQFCEFCEGEEIANINSLTGRDLHRYRVWRSGDIAPVTLNGELSTLRVFLEFCADIDAVEAGMRERVRMPDLDDGEEARDEHIAAQRASDILEHLNRFEYASRDHVMFAILWHTGIRLGSLRAFDVSDFDSETQCLDLRHRPEKGTQLKNKAAAERSLAVSDNYCVVIEDYIKHNRQKVTDEHGRRPLLTSSQGRLSEGAIRESVYKLTQPCEIEDCPHDKTESSCEYRQHGNRAGCPSSHSPHNIRRGSITEHLRNGTPQEVVSDRSDVTADTLEKHYDERTEREKMETRRDFIEGI